MAQYVKDETLMWLWHNHVSGCTRDSLVETACCWSKFTDQMLKSAYSLVYSYLEATDRDKPAKQNRRGSNNDYRRRVVEDILDVFEYSGYISMENMPVFVAVDPSVLPPQSPTSADLAVVLRTLAAHSDRLAALEVAAVAGSYTGARSGRPPGESGQSAVIAPGLGSAAGPSTGAQKTALQQPTYSGVLATQAKQRGDNSAEAGMPSSAVVHTGQSLNNTWTEVGKNGRPLKRHLKMRSRANIIRGNMDNALCSIRGVSRQKHVFVSRTNPDTTCDDVIKWVKDQCNLTIGCEKLETKAQGYASFRLSCTEEQCPALLSAEVWPNNIIVRPWYGATMKARDSGEAQSVSESKSQC